MRTTLPHRYRTLVLWLCGAVLCLGSWLVLWVVAQVEARMVREENAVSVVENDLLERAIRPLAEVWAEENRRKY